MKLFYNIIVVSFFFFCSVSFSQDISLNKDSLSIYGSDSIYVKNIGNKTLVITNIYTINSMYWYPSFEAKAISDIGLRGYIGAPLITGITTLEDAIDIVEKHHDTSDELIRVTLSLHSPYTVTLSDFQKAHDYASDYNSESEKPQLLIHTHLAESETEMQDSRDFNKKYNQDFPDVKTPVELLDSINQEILNDLVYRGLKKADWIHIYSFGSLDNVYQILGQEFIEYSVTNVKNIMTMCREEVRLN